MPLCHDPPPPVSVRVTGSVTVVFLCDEQQIRLTCVSVSEDAEPGNVSVYRCVQTQHTSGINEEPTVKHWFLNPLKRAVEESL